MADEGRQRLLPRLLDEESGSGEGEPSQGTSRWKGLKRRLNAVSAIKTPGAFPKMIGAEPVDLQKITNSMRQLGVSRPVKVSMYEFGPSALRENREMTNAEFLEVLQGLGPMEQEFKCRYIHIQGLSWDILEALGTKYSIHSLALEDCAHVPQRIKVDYYENMVYASLVSVTIKAKAGEPGTKVLSRVSTRGYSKAELGDSDSTRAPLLKYASGKFAWLSLANMLAALETSQVALLLLKDGTVISMFQEGGDRVLKPIEQKIRTEGTMLRESGDPSFLVHSIIDAIVDLMSEVVDGYAEDVAAVEDRVLRLSDVSTDLIKEIHLVGTRLALLKCAFCFNACHFSDHWRTRCPPSDYRAFTGCRLQFAGTSCRRRGHLGTYL